ncbi:DUF1648 domain-containing protein [Chryseobacterium tructae]|uniref:DUF1648 domain-containing protein n=1 Tax=Chryseobacterium tructae TaxID=1037380 RepID=A0ABV7XTC2_9FLAO|nr:DUF1648 domain-containing protein [Chryseobacterium tructae]MDN3691109.1 DUF1648 domain-containing protein [Chryseobacterium tructae]
MKTSSILLIVNTILLIVIWVFTGVKYAGLPEIIPTHFNFQGKVNRESGKLMIWLLPCIAAFVHFIFIWASKNPDSPFVNVPKSFRNKKTLKLYLFSLEIPVMVLFLDIIIESIRVAEGKQTELSNAIFFILGVMFVILGVGLIKSIQEGITKSND